MATAFEDVRVLEMASEFADEVYRIAAAWDNFSRDVVGKQITRAADSIGANIAEAYGRFHYGEKINLLYYARGSLFETKYWLNRSRSRKLLNDADAVKLIERLADIAKQINAFVSNLKNQRQAVPTRAVRESSADYIPSTEPINEIFDPNDLAWLADTNL